MPTFSNNILTTAGKNLIAQATAANPIVYTGSLALEAYIPPATLVNFDLPYGVPNKIDGTIVSASAVGSVARVIAGFTNQASAKVIKTCIVYGRLENDTTDHCIIACSDETASIRIPSTSEASVQVQVSLNVSVNDDGTVTVTSGNAASVGDLDRMISCYKPGNPAEGVAQNVYGEKSFIDGAKTDSIGSVSGHGITVNDDLYMTVLHAAMGSFTSIGKETGTHVNVTCSLLPNFNIAWDIGGASDRFKNIYAQNVSAVTITPINDGVNTKSIGISENRFLYGYINNVESTTIIPNGVLTSIGGVGKEWDYIYGKNINAGNISGLVPNAYSNSGCVTPVGSIVCVKLPASVISSGGMYAGQVVTLPSGTIVYCASLDGSFEGNVLKVSGKFRLLSNIADTGGAAIIMKIYDD